METKIGSLHVIGTGIKSISHLTTETKGLIASCDKLLYVVADPITKEWLLESNESAEDMMRFYEKNKPREQTYIDMAEYSLSFVRKGMNVCVAYYGHPGVFVAPSHMSLKTAREEGYFVEMLPGISAEDCLFCDLGIDPARTGCQSYEATDFLVYSRNFDNRSSLILWQIGVIGYFDFQNKYDNAIGLKVLTEHLLKFYFENHEVVIYEASMFSVAKPLIKILEMKDLETAVITPISTLFVPPVKDFKANPEMIEKLGIPEKYLQRHVNSRLIESSMFNAEFVRYN
jgi:uncharacterized protein YabN with tetrapyrrole methylase and pyrophosphatase domain